MFENSPGKPFILVGCKTDLRGENHSCNKSDGVEQDGFVSQTQVCKFLHCFWF